MTTQRRSSDSPTKSRGWLPRFGLTTALVMTALFCLVMGAWLLCVQPYRVSAQVVQRGLDLSGRVDTEPAPGPAWQAWLVDRMLGPGNFRRVVAVNWYGCKLTPTDFQRLARLRWVEELRLDRTDATNGDVKRLAGLPELRELSLSYTQVSDEGVARLAAAPKLESLWITGCDVTDDALERIDEQSALRHVYARWTKITKTAAAEFQRRHRHCQVYCTA